MLGAPVRDPATLPARWSRGEPLGRDGFGGLAVGELAARHAARELDDLLPETTDPARTAHAEAHVVVLVVLAG